MPDASPLGSGAAQVAADRRVEGFQVAAGVVAEPDVLVVVGLETVGLVAGDGRILRHVVPAATQEVRWLGVSGLLPGPREHQVLDAHQHHGAVCLGLVEQDGGIPEVGMGAAAVNTRLGGGEAQQVGGR